MIHAHIVTSSGSMYLAAEGDPYDMENLYQHVLQMRGDPQRAVRLEIAFDPSSEGRRMRTLIERWKKRGVEVVLGREAVGGGVWARRGCELESVAMAASDGQRG